MPDLKVLVTEGRGVIGSNLIQELEKRGHEVWACDLMHCEMENYHRCARELECLRLRSVKCALFLNFEGVID